jgi:hypothetical protein
MATKIRTSGKCTTAGCNLPVTCKNTGTRTLSSKMVRKMRRTLRKRVRLTATRRKRFIREINESAWETKSGKSGLF